MTIPLHCLHCGSEARVARRPCPLMVNKRIAVTLVGVAAVRILPPMPIHKLAARRVCMPLKNASLLRGLTRIDRRSLEQPSPVGSKKGAQLPPLHATLLAPDPEDRTSTTLELDAVTALKVVASKHAHVGSALPLRASRRFASRCFHSYRQNWADRARDQSLPLHRDKEESLLL